MSGVLANEVVYFHTGTISTFETFMAMVPSHGWAVTVLANSNTKARELVMYRALYDLLGVEEGKRVDFEPKYVGGLVSSISLPLVSSLLIKRNVCIFR